MEDNTGKMPRYKQMPPFGNQPEEESLTPFKRLRDNPAGQKPNPDTSYIGGNQGMGPEDAVFKSHISDGETKKGPDVPAGPGEGQKDFTG